MAPSNSAAPLHKPTQDGSGEIIGPIADAEGLIRGGIAVDASYAVAAAMPLQPATKEAKEVYVILADAQGAATHVLRGTLESPEFGAYQSLTLFEQVRMDRPGSPSHLDYAIELRLAAKELGFMDETRGVPVITQYGATLVKQRLQAMEFPSAPLAQTQMQVPSAPQGAPVYQPVYPVAQAPAQPVAPPTDQPVLQNKQQPMTPPAPPPAHPAAAQPAAAAGVAPPGPEQVGPGMASAIPGRKPRNPQPQSAMDNAPSGGDGALAAIEPVAGTSAVSAIPGIVTDV